MITEKDIKRLEAVLFSKVDFRFRALEVSIQKLKVVVEQTLEKAKLLR